MKISKSARGQLLLDARRIVVVGAPGSGKSTMARHLHSILHRPLYHLDDIYWLPGWRRVSVETFSSMQREIAALDEWIIDGNHFDSLPIRLVRADAVCIMNVPTIVALGGFMSRACCRLIGDTSSLPRAIRGDMGRTRGWSFDSKVLKTLLLFRRVMFPKIIDLVASDPSHRAVAVVDSWQDGKRLIEEVTFLRRGEQP